MYIQLILIGNELLDGSRSDENGKWLAHFLKKEGLKIDEITVIPDNEEAMKRSILEAWSKSNLVIISGGLGPTKDDKTKNILGEAFNKKLVFNSITYEQVKNNQERSGRDNEETRKHYSHIPEEFTSCENPNGIAPGLIFSRESKILVALPGVPSEFSQMFEHNLWNLIKKKLKIETNFSSKINIRTKMIPEEYLFTKLSPNLWSELLKFGEPYSLPHTFNVDIGVNISAQNEDELNQKKMLLLKYIETTPFKDSIWQIGDIPLEEYIVNIAKEKNITFSFAESCTGGLNASNITNVSGSSEVFFGGVVSYSNESKVDIIDVKEETLKKFGAVSLETAKEMAFGVRRKTKTDIGISTTGIAGPHGGSVEKPVGTVCIGISRKDGKVNATSYKLKGDRLKLKERFSKIALFTLLDEIKDLK